MKRPPLRLISSLIVVVALYILLRIANAREPVRVQAQNRFGVRGGQQDSKPGRDEKLAGQEIRVWRPANWRTGVLPLVVFSHGFGGSNSSSSALMMSIADAGYLVVAPNHKDAIVRGTAATVNRQPPQQPFGSPKMWNDTTYKDRNDDIKNLLQSLHKTPKWATQIDWSRVALVGHSLGGYTALGCAGAWSSWKLPEIKVVVAWSPYCAPYIEKSTLGAITVPVMYQGGTLDIGITPSVKRSNGAFDQTNGPTEFIEYQGAGHLAWADIQPKYQSSIAYYTIGFLDKHLKHGKPVDLRVKKSDVSELRIK